MPSRKVWVARSARLALPLALLLGASCASCPPAGDSSQAAASPQRALESSHYVRFPPQHVMKSSDYARLLTDNRRALEQCQKGTGCEVALFNLGFVHAYPQSPYYDPAKALQYFDELLKKYPQTSWASESRAWRDLLNEHVASEEKRRRLQTELRAKDATIRSLRTQLHRSRAIDLEFDQKERELLR
jgi:hypothetical protein